MVNSSCVVACLKPPPQPRESRVFNERSGRQTGSRVHLSMLSETLTDFVAENWVR
jgi:hypothetical protein